MLRPMRMNKRTLFDKLQANSATRAQACLYPRNHRIVLSVLRSRFAVLSFIGVWALGLGASVGNAQTSLEKPYDYKAELESVRAYLSDGSFGNEWVTPQSFKDADDARRVLKLSQERMDEIQRQAHRGHVACMEKFLANRCDDQIQELAKLRLKDLRRIQNLAYERVHQARAEELAKKRSNDTEKPKEGPMKLTPKVVDTTPHEPIRLQPKAPKAPTMPQNLTQLDSEGGATDNASAATQAQIKAQEQANVAYYNEKQRKAQARIDEAQARAEKNRQARLEKKKQFEETLQRRVEAQKRYEEYQKNRGSGLSEFF